MSEWIPTPAPEYTQAEKMILLRERRNKLLFQSDWTQITDAQPVGGKEAWAIYRQQLRDLPATVIDVDNVIWPIPPSEQE